ncbi:MAG: MFS transporter [Phycisphaerales bacterium]|nr:MFS transporter [Phycisphaerales bacterium]
MNCEPRPVETAAEPTGRRDDSPPAPLPRERAAVAYWLLNASHAVIDIFPIFMTSLMIVFQDKLALTEGQVTILYMATPIFSGLFQPFFAWWTDHRDTRFCGWFGLVLGGVCISSIGLAQNFWQLLLLQAVGVIGTGMYHPIGAALAGQLGHRAMRHGRAMAISVFIAAGMIGQTAGPLICTRINDLFGLGHLLWLIAPALLTAFILHRATSHLPHRHDNHREIHASFPPGERRRRVAAVALLTASNSARFICNIGLFVMFNHWARAHIPADADSAANLNGNLSSAMTLGMCISVLIAGRLIKPGREKGAFILASLIGAVFVGGFGFIGEWCWGLREQVGWIALVHLYAVASATAIGFFSTVPTSVGLAQRILPGHTGMASALMMGVGWTVSALAKPAAGVFVGGVPLDQSHTIPTPRLQMAFVGFAGFVLLAAVLVALVPGRLLRDVARYN